MPSARDPFMWPLHVTPTRDFTLWLLHMAFVQLNLICGVKSIKHLVTILRKAQLFWSAKDP